MRMLINVEREMRFMKVVLEGIMIKYEVLEKEKEIKSKFW